MSLGSPWVSPLTAECCSFCVSGCPGIDCTHLLPTYGAGGILAAKKAGLNNKSRESLPFPPQLLLISAQSAVPGPGAQLGSGGSQIYKPIATRRLVYGETG